MKQIICCILLVVCRNSKNDMYQAFPLSPLIYMKKIKQLSQNRTNLYLTSSLNFSFNIWSFYTSRFVGNFLNQFTKYVCGTLKKHSEKVEGISYRVRFRSKLLRPRRVEKWRQSRGRRISVSWTSSRNTCAVLVMIITV